ncbi:rod shape-determining protein MreD [Streptomyces albus]|uniref:Rod shape-determining protein MreD n=1 Tax=Streptomyces albus TaxID=1888 RepID=A0A8H1LGD4_9ACTN|nr:rod shape-determining protein MreD [Streptomyces albus]TGG83580.1 rod shape-determining protein MreD [Streptomyces albus]UVN59223.1 rod shape-determining protein MreD [Streptomyces albus]
MYVNRMLLTAALVVVALVVQVAVLARLQLPGAVPDLLLLVVLGLALVYGHTAGALVGFFAGLLADIAPPADHAVGRYALVLCLIGYAAGLTKPEGGAHRSATVPMLVVASAAICSTLLYAGVGALVGDAAARQVGLTGLLITATVYDLLLAPFTVPLIMALARRGEKDPIGAETGGTGGLRAYGWLGSGTGLTTSGTGLLSKGGKAPKMGKAGKRSARNAKPATLAAARGKAGKIKGVKRL